MLEGDTIVAIATPPGRGGVGVIRVSGPSVPALMEEILGRPIEPRMATLCRFSDGEGAAIDYGIGIYFSAPHSYTGEHVLEIQGHGGQVVMSLIVERCLALGARLAGPGEFTRRAFLNGKIDLAQAESVADLIDATTRSAARSAVRSLQGDFSRRIDALLKEMIDLRMLVEATLDFPDEEIDFLESHDARGKAAKLLGSISDIVSTARQGAILRSGIQVVIAGKPNAGKSSLLNRLSGEEVAIVTDIPGTTRDAIRQSIEIGGIPIHVIDTAGLRESSDSVEIIGMERTRNILSSADVILYIADAVSGLDDDDEKILATLPDLPAIIVMNKIDLVPEVRFDTATGRRKSVGISAKTGQGMDDLKAALLDLLAWHSVGEDQFIARERHVHALREAGDAVSRAIESPSPEFIAEELRLAQQSLSKITGEYTADDLLGEIFSRFCIGK